jgi:hypothetical protein
VPSQDLASIWGTMPGVGRKRRRGRPVGEYFMAAVGVVLIAFVAVLIATSGSCHIRPAPELFEQPGATRPTPTAPR